MNVSLDRAEGLLVGLAFGDRWRTATEVALCVADAAAPGLPLDDPRAQDLLRRNLREWRHDRPGTEILASGDALLAACAVVALAHHRDGAQERILATAAVLLALNARSGVDEGLVAWSDAVADAVGGATVDPAALRVPGPWLNERTAVADLLQAAGSAASGEREALVRGHTAARLVPAASGAILGAVYGVEDRLDGPAGAVSGWPDADTATLRRIASDVSAPRDRGRPVPVSHADPPAGPAVHPVVTRTTPLDWRVVRVALTARETEPGR